MSKLELTKEISTLSIIDIITLQKLIDHPRPVLRFSLYQEINHYLSIYHSNYSSTSSESELSSPLSTSSFYNRLNSLETKGLVQFKKKKVKGTIKIVAVKATEKAKTSIFGLIGHLLSMTLVDNSLLVEIFTQVSKKFEIAENANILAVNLSEAIDFKLMNFGAKITNNMYLLAEESVIDNLKKMGIDQLKFSSMIDRSLREPNDVFNYAIIPQYEKNPRFFGLSRIEILKELRRVVKPDGYVTVLVRSPMPEIPNYYAKMILEKYEETIAGQIFTSEELTSDFVESGFSDIEVLDFNGIYVGMGRV
jgi:hypothetical protein